MATLESRIAALEARCPPSTTPEEKADILAAVKIFFSGIEPIGMTDGVRDALAIVREVDALI